MQRIKTKPLSVNDVWKGKRFKTRAYKDYEEELFVLLPRSYVQRLSEKGKLFVKLNFGFSSKGSDADNCVKPFIDILQKAYGFNDNRIYRFEITKEDVEKGGEFIEFSIEELK